MKGFVNRYLTDPLPLKSDSRKQPQQQIIPWTLVTLVLLTYVRCYIFNGLLNKESEDNKQYRKSKRSAYQLHQSGISM